MSKALRPHKPLASMPLCPGWFFGGRHCWPAGMVQCSVRRRQKPPYQHKWTRRHEWDKGLCVHCGLLRGQAKIKPKASDKCLLCGKTRAQLLAMFARGEQPKLGCEDFGHKVARNKATPRLAKASFKEPLRLVVDNTQRKGLFSRLVPGNSMHRRITSAGPTSPSRP